MPSSAAAASGRRISSRCWPTDPGNGGAYNIPVTILSLIFAISVTFVGLSIAVSSLRTLWVVLGGAIVGGGVAAMHYTGMAALEIPARVSWVEGTVIASVLFGIVFAALALFVAARRDDRSHALAATGLLTLAIVAHHFTAMGAVLLTPDPTLAISGLSIPPASMSFLTASAAVAIIAIALVSALLDRRAKGELRTPAGRARYRAREHVAGTVHVRCGRQDPAVQRALRRDARPHRHSAAPAACSSTCCGKSRPAASGRAIPTNSSRASCWRTRARAAP